MPEQWTMCPLTRRHFLAAGAALAGSAVLPRPLLARGGNSKRPNIILCMTDDQGWGDTGYNGHPVLRTPHLPVVSAPPYTDGYTEHPDYYGCLTAMDEQMGRLRAELGKLGVADDTMIWVCSDNGPEGEDRAPGRTGGFRGRKRSLYEGGVRVPGLLVWPGMIDKARAVSMPCSTSDYFPTVLDVLGHELPEAKTRPYDGISLLPLIKGEMTERPRLIGFESTRQVTLVDNRYKIYCNDRGQTFELYDLIEDAHEKNNLAESHPQVVERMGKTLAEWRESCKASHAGRDY